MEERRKFLRQKSFLRACVYFNNGNSTVECVVRDVSPAGARLVVPDGVIIPDAIELYIAQTEQNARAQVLWRRNNELGLVFTTALEAAEQLRGTAGLAERVKKLEREIDALKRMFKRLKAATAAESDIEAA